MPAVFGTVFTCVEHVQQAKKSVEKIAKTLTVTVTGCRISNQG